ncbi:hypothetical protein F4677DRAFT_452593 [Hypoxylon crocopeplum]|nr:hypothetical protein F4677DRAFT_452593 [Hypoxylon crocopeplum]
MVCLGVYRPLLGNTYYTVLSPKADTMESEFKFSLRPSISTPALRATENRPGSFRSTRSKGGLRRHALLKMDPSSDHSTKDLPVPPVLTPALSEPTERNITMKHKFSSVTVPSRKSSKTSLMAQDQGTPDIDTSRQPAIVCIDPTIHPPGTHAKIHHPGLVAGADFCDAGLATERDSPIRTPPSRLSPIDLVDEVLTGRTQRLLTGGDICQEIIDVSEHIHGNHSSAIKVRPALGLFYGDGKHGGHSGISKVQPASEDTRDRVIIHHSKEPAIVAPTPEKPYVLEHLHHSHSLAPKVGPFLDDDSLQGSNRKYPNDTHEGHVWVQKVQSYHGSSSASFNTEENSIPRLAMKEPTDQVKKDEESSKATSYWGFFPRFGEKKDEEANASHEPVGQSTAQNDTRETPESSSKSRDRSVVISRVENRPSLSASQYSASQKSFDIISKVVTKLTESTGNQGHFRCDSESISSLGRPFDTFPSQERLVLQNNEEKETSTSPVSPLHRSNSERSYSDQPKESEGAERIDPGRTATWLRQLLGHSEPSGPNLTQLPEKSHPRHQEHHDYPNDNITMIASRVTTFSAENEAGAGVMDTVVHDLERLLNEALVLADVATEGDRCAHDGVLRSRLQSTSEVAHELPSPTNVHGRLENRSSENAQKPIPPGTPPNILMGTVEGLMRGLETSPLKSAGRRKLTKPDIYSGNVQGPSYPHGALNTRGFPGLVQESKTGREIYNHVSDDGSVLPMPPPDSQLKRQPLSPLPHTHAEDDPTEAVKSHTRDIPNSSRNIREASNKDDTQLREDVDVCSLGGGGTSDDVVDFSTQYNSGERQATEIPGFRGSRHNHNHSQNAPTAKTSTSQRQAPTKRSHEVRNISLRRRSHVSIRDGQRFSLTKSMRRQPTIARDWSPARKRFVASVACISTALIGVLVGIYAGLVPSIQYYIADFNHYSIIGNVVMYLGMALSTFLCWPLPLLHGRKPYILCSLCVAMPLLFPQAIAVSAPRSPYTSVWRWALLLPRAVMGCALGFASMNFHSILTDLFGASLMSSNPHQEVVDRRDVRRHGGGLGIWLGVWTWCFIGSLGIGFLVGALIIDSLQPSWGLYISIMLIAVVLVLNVLCPEVRRSGWRHSVAEVRTGSAVSRRVARGEIMMHRVKDGPKWWGQEMYHGVALSLEMLRQPGFVIMAVYSAWIYAQVVLIIVLLGSLSSRHYHFRSPFVGAAVSSVAVGALAAVPFQMANVFSRSRSTGPLTNSMTFDKKVTWTSHLVRRAIFIIVLPIAGVLIGFIFAAGATGIGGMATRSLGQRAATGVVAAILFFHSLLLLCVFARFRQVQIVPNSKSTEMDRWTKERRDSLRRRASAIAAAKANGLDVSEIPEEDFRRMNILELGSLTRWSDIRKKNRLIDEGVHLNRQTVDMARDEIGRRGNDFMDDFGEIVRKASKRSLRSMRSKRSHNSDQDDNPRVELQDMGPLGPPGAGLEHHHTTLPREVYFERECVMGQTVLEEGEISSTDGESDDDGWDHGPDHSSHMMSKVQPYIVLEKQGLRGGTLSTGDHVIDMDTSEAGHASRTKPTLKPANPDGSGHRAQHGAHMEGKVRPADVEVESLAGDHSAHMQESKGYLCTLTQTSAHQC